MVFRYPQLKHDLIPQAHDPGNDLTLATQLKTFRESMFQLFQSKVDEVLSVHSEDENPAQMYWAIRQALDECPEVKAVHKRRGVLQDQLWSKVLGDIAADRQRLEMVYGQQQKGLGGLELNPALDIPLHQHKTHIHRMPGGYLQDMDEDPCGAGMLYDHGVFLYGYGWFGSLNDELGQTLIHHVLKEHYPGVQPQAILDLGCSVGHSTLPYATAFPEATVWGVDLGASLVRYAIARARVLNHTVYFAQQNAEQTDFPEQSFDLVVSHILLHEIPAVARKRVFSESYRLLKPGGLMVHLESKLFLDPPSFVSRYFRDTEVWANSEPYLASSKWEDFPNYALDAGFALENFNIHSVPGYYAAQNGKTNAGWAAFCGVKH